MGVSSQTNSESRGIAGWARSRSLTPLFFEGVGVSPQLLPRLAAEAGLEVDPVDGHSPRQADVLIVAGPIPIKLMPVLQRMWRAMRAPRWCVAFGGGEGHGVDSYALVTDIRRFVPVDVFVPECPPTAESMREAIDQVRRLAGGASS